MGKKLFITEKPSVAMEFRKALHVIPKGKTDGYIEGDDTIITWCVGHLITMSYPEKYDDELKRWSMDTLPFLPKQFKYEVIESARKQYMVVKAQMERPDVDVIYYSGDAAREGEYIQRLVRQTCHIRSGVTEKRVWIDSQTEDEILRGIREAKDLSAYDRLSDSGYMRAAEDYLFGINLSRAYSVKFGQLYNNIIDTPKYEAIAVGRVMTCVLGMIVDRERLIRNSKEIPFYGVRAKFSKALQADWMVGVGSAYTDSPLLHKNNALLSKEAASELRQACESVGQLLLKEKEVKNETKNAPLLYNLAELQGDCSQALKISPDQTLEIVQSLYEKKMVTYPRTDARVLSSAVAKEIRKNLKGLQNHPVYGDAALKAEFGEKTDRIGSTRYTNDDMISDHYAIIPTGEFTENYGSLSALEKSVYDMIVLRFLAIFYPDAVFEKVSCKFLCGNEWFAASDKKLKSAGFYELEGVKVDVTDSPLKELQEGQPYPADFSVTEGKATPPKRYTGGSMILAMENAGQLIEDAELRARIKGSGIGTSATRAETLKKLISNKYILLNEKTQVLTPSERGEVIYDIVKAITPSLLRPEMTANWEKGLDMITAGEVTKEGYLEKLHGYVMREVSAVKQSDYEAIKGMLPKEKKQTSNTGQYSKKKVKPKFTAKHPKKFPEKCPHCGSALREFDWGTVCTGCYVSIPKTIAGLPLAAEHRVALLYEGETEKIEGFRKKDGTGIFSAKLKADEDWKITFSFK